MTALAVDRLVDIKEYFTDPKGVKRDFAVAASTVIYKGGFVGLNAAGYLVMYAPPTVGTTVVGGHRFVGLAREHVASQTADGLKRCEVLIKGSIVHALSGAVVADIGKPVFASDDNTLTDASLGNAYVGYISNFVSAGNVVVEIDMVNGGTVVEKVFASPIIAGAAANIVRAIHPTQNNNGFLVTRAYGYCTTTFTTTTTYTLQDTAGSPATTGITFVTLTTTVAGDAIPPAVAATTANSTYVGIGDGAAMDANLIFVPAGLGLDIKVTTTGSGAGAAKFWVKGHDVA